MWRDRYMQLDPCPFCGASSNQEDAPDGLVVVYKKYPSDEEMSGGFVGCNCCGAQGPDEYYATEVYPESEIREQLTKKWNGRSSTCRRIKLQLDINLDTGEVK